MFTGHKSKFATGKKFNFIGCSTTKRPLYKRHISTWNKAINLLHDLLPIWCCGEHICWYLYLVFMIIRLWVMGLFIWGWRCFANPAYMNILSTATILHLISLPFVSPTTSRVEIILSVLRACSPQNLSKHVEISRCVSDMSPVGWCLCNKVMNWINVKAMTALSQRSSYMTMHDFVSKPLWLRLVLSEEDDTIFFIVAKKILVRMCEVM